MQQEWINWSGSIRFIPKSVETPENEEMLADLVRQAGSFKRNVRVVGSSHSCSQVFESVRAFQQRYASLSNDGVIGQNTWRVIIDTVS